MQALSLLELFIEVRSVELPLREASGDGEDASLLRALRCCNDPLRLPLAFEPSVGEEAPLLFPLAALRDSSSLGLAFIGVRSRSTPDSGTSSFCLSPPFFPLPRLLGRRGAALVCAFSSCSASRLAFSSTSLGGMGGKPSARNRRRTLLASGSSEVTLMSEI